MLASTHVNDISEDTSACDGPHDNLSETKTFLLNDSRFSCTGMGAINCPLLEGSRTFPPMESKAHTPCYWMVSRASPLWSLGLCLVFVVVVCLCWLLLGCWMGDILGVVSLYSHAWEWTI